jgi:hypothetical protein
MHRRSPVGIFLFMVIGVLALFLVLGTRQTPQFPQKSISATTGSHLESAGARTLSSHRHSESAERSEGCSDPGLGCTSEYFQTWSHPGDGTCAASMRNGYPVPDTRCTPGGINPSITAEMLRDSGFKTHCIRNCQTSEAEKHVTYRWYGIQKPRSNSGENQVCELDHLIPLELGGADGLGNIWPECGPHSTVLEHRYFKIKDRVENYLADEVKAGRISLNAAQKGIASDWTQFLPAANRYCAAHGRC